MAHLPVRLFSLLLAFGILLGQGSTRYSKYLKALHEPSLQDLALRDPNAEVYRFLWLRTFDHPIAIRLVIRPSGSGWINSRMTRGQGGYEPGGITRYNVSWLSKAKTHSFLDALESANFWNLPTLQEANGSITLDGANWIIEGVRNGKYRVVERQSPRAGDPVREIGEKALKLSRFKIRSAEIY